MAVTRQFLALSVITAAAIGAGTWATVAYLSRSPREPTRAVSTAAPEAARSQDPRRIKVTLFYVAADGLTLTAAERDVLFADGPSEQAKRIVEALLEPAPGPLVSAIPPGTTLRGLYLGEGGDAYVDFSGTLRSNHPGGSQNEMLTVYAIVSALTVNLPAITSVQILLDGHEVDTLAGHVDLRRPLPNARHWMQKGTT